MREIIVIFDGQCQLCQNAIAFIQKRLEITALDFHITDHARYNLTYDECAKQVIVISGNTTYRAAAAVAFLLHARGNTVLSRTISASGKLGELAYRWVATHRSSLPIKALTVLLKRVAR